MASMSVRIPLAFALVLVSGSAWAQEDAPTENERLHEEVNRLKAKQELQELQYGKPLEGKAGDITGAENVSGIAQQKALTLGARTAKDLAEAVQKETSICAKSVLVTDDSAVATKLMLARSIQENLENLDLRIKLADKQVDKQSGSRNLIAFSGVVLGAAAIQGIAGTIVGITKLFRADYTINSFQTKNDPDWIASHFLMNVNSFCLNADVSRKSCPVSYYSDRLPTTSAGSKLVGQINELLASSTKLQGKVDSLYGDTKVPAELARKAEAASILAAVKKLHYSLLDGGASGVAPFTALSAFMRATTDQSCIVRLIDTAPSGVAMTKNTILGKGGTVYLHTAAQLAAVVTNAEGVPLYTACRQNSLATTVKLSALARKANSYVAPPWEGSDGITQNPLDCGSDITAVIARKP